MTGLLAAWPRLQGQGRQADGSVRACPLGFIRALHVCLVRCLQ